MKPGFEFPAFLAVTGVAEGETSRADWVGMVLRELGRSQAGGFVIEILKWTTLGALAGILIALAAYFIFVRLGWYDLRWRFARGLRWTSAFVTTLLAGGIFALVGFWSGAISGSERVLAGSQLGTDLFPKIGDAIADGMGWVQIHALDPGNTNLDVVKVKLESFRAGEWELDAAQFLVQLDQLQTELVEDTLQKLEASALERTPQLQDGLTEKLLHSLLHGMGRALVEKKAERESKKWGADRVLLAIRQQLTDVAARAGNPETIAHREISEFVVQEGIVPAIMHPIRTTARSQQWPLVAIAFVLVIAPPVIFRLTRNRFGRRPKTDDAGGVLPKLNPPS